MFKPQTVKVSMQVTGYRSNPKESTIKLTQAFTDLAVDSCLAYHHFASENQDTTIDMLFHEARWASRIGIECWYYNLQNMRLAYRLGYLDLINWGGADWINDCCDYFRDDRAVAIWFRKMSSVYVKLSNFKLPKMGEVWSNNRSQVMIVSVQPNHIDDMFYQKEMIVLFDKDGVGTLDTETLLNFVQHYQFESH